MSGKFIKFKKMVVPMLTIMMAASQLMGCASVSQSELLKMLNEGRAIEVEVMAPVSQEQGTEKQLEWVALDKLTTYEKFRHTFDSELLVIKTNGTKNGVQFINLKGEQEGNNTLFNAFQNRKFISGYWENDSVQLKVQNAVSSLYSDVTMESPTAQYAAVNAYWNILPDSEPSYFNGGSTLSRGEFMAAVMRAETPVTEDGRPAGKNEFSTAVGSSEFTDYASAEASYSYLDTVSKSLDNLTFNGTITRAEAVYLLVNKYFPEQLRNADTKASKLSDCKNGGDIATKQKFKVDGTGKEHFKAYELTYALQNPDNGVPQDLFRALVAGNELGIINNETRWDEGLTKEEAIEFITRAYTAYTKLHGYAVDSTRGTVEEVEGTEAVPEEIEESLTNPVSVTAEPENESEEAEIKAEVEAGNMEVPETVEVEELSITLYTTADVVMREKNSVASEKLKTVPAGTAVIVTGVTHDKQWYRVKDTEKGEGFISGAYLSSEKPVPKQEEKKQETTSGQQTTNPGADAVQQQTQQQIDNGGLDEWGLPPSLNNGDELNDLPVFDGSQIEGTDHGLHAG